MVPSRSIEREAIARRLDPIKTGKNRDLEKPLLIVSTQCIEAGVDIDLDGLITEAAPLDSLRQRFGRLNREGREIVSYAAIVGSGGKVYAKDPVYGEAIVNTWKYLAEHPDKAEDKKKKQPAEIDFGLAAFSKRTIDSDLLAPKADAPVLLPAHLDLLSQTSPIPTADPEVALYLHGPGRTADSVAVVWRSDVDPAFSEGTYQLMLLVPPRAAEVIELPVWVVRRWLTEERPEMAGLADVPALEPKPEEKESPWRSKQERRVFRWTGEEDSSAWILPQEIRPGDTVVVPAAYGGVDRYGWNPEDREPAEDVAAPVAEPYEGHKFAVRVAPGLLNFADDDTRLARAIAAADTRQWKYLREAVLSVGLPPKIAENLKKTG